MLILALDSCATVATVALIRDGDIVGEYTLNAGNTHSVTLLPMIEHLLKVAKIPLDRVDAFAVSLGPGSFTGVRIGVATLKGICLKDNKPLIGVSSLEALSYNLALCRGIVCPVMNARRDQVYTAVFRSDGNALIRLTNDMAISVAQLAKMLTAYDEPVYFTGDGYFLCEALTDRITPPRLRLQSAVGVAVAAERLWNEAPDKSVFSAALASPVYLRRPQAEREREERMKQAESDN